MKLLEIFFIVFILNVFLFEVESVVNCKLQWHTVGAGEEVPDTSVQVANQSPILYIVKDEGNKIGFLYEGVGHIPLSVNQKTGRKAFYKVLTNPYGCLLEWRNTAEDTHYPVTFNGAFVGRGLTLTCIDSIIFPYVSGTVSNNKILLPVIDNYPKQSNEYQILHSYWHGLNLQLKRLIITNQEIGPMEKKVLGMDQIINESPATIRHYVKQESVVKEETTITTSSTSSATFNFAAKANLGLKVDYNISGLLEIIPIPKVNSTGDFDKSFPLEFEKEFDIKSQESKSVVKTLKQTRFGIEKQVVVPSYASIQVCSTVTLQPFTASYSAKGVYTSPSLTGAEVADQLEKTGITDYIIEGNSAVTTQDGTLEGNIVVGSNFFMMNLDDEIGCHVVTK